jgi:hypothetical protein
MSGISKIKWEYCEKTPKISTPWVFIVAKYDFSLPAWINENKNCRIEITTDTEESCYKSVIWWFNRGIEIVSSIEEIKSIFECEELTEIRLNELFSALKNGE